MKKSKRFISLLLAFVMLLSITAGFGIITFAEGFTDGDYEYNLCDDGTAAIIKYNGSATELVIPSEIDGHPVTYISYMAFGDCTSLTNVIIPDSVITIGYNAFIGCESLVSVTLPDGLTDITYSVFGGCKNLKNIIIPNSVTTIAQWAFAGCESLSYIKIPESVEVLASGAFADCSSLKGALILNKDCLIQGSFYEEDGNLEDIIIYSYRNSTAQTYAEEEGYDFIAIDEPILADGTNTEYTIGSEKSASIHCAYPLEEFVSVSVNGNIVDESNYALEDGSTILTFKPSYLNTLKAGEYMVALNYTMGTVETSLKITDNAETPTDKPSEPVTETPTDKPSEPATAVPTETPTKPTAETPTEPTTEKAENTPTATTTAPSAEKTSSSASNSEKSPSTGYDYLAALTFMIAVVSGCGSVICFISSKKKKYEH